MRTCLVALSLILAIEGFLAWSLGLHGVAAMLAGTVAAGGLASLWQRRGGEWGWVFLAGLYVAGSIAMVGAFGVPAIIIAVSGLHFVAWYYSARAIRSGAPQLLPGTLDGRPGVFEVAFYGALLLAVFLLRGGFFPIAPAAGVLLAFCVFLLGLVLMEKGRFLRMREGAADRPSRKRGIVARALAAAALGAALFFLFAKPVPAVADGLVKMVLDLQGKTEDSGLDADDMPPMDDVAEKEPPPPPPPTGDEVVGGEGAQQVAGDPLTQRRSLPDRADLQSQHAPVAHLQFDNPSQAAALSRRPIYVRSSTLGRYAAGEWGRVGEGVPPVWLSDREDGREDGRVTLEAAFPNAKQAALLRYKVYVRGSTGAGLLSLQGVSEFELPEVLRYDDDWYRARLLGNIAYRAASRPLQLDDLLAAADGLDTADPGGRGVYLDLEDTPLMRRISGLLDEMPAGSLGERLQWLREYFAANYRYSSVIENVDLLDPLENFLFVEKAGYCDFFATAGALLVRKMGVPSRIGYGYSKGEFDGESVFTFHADEAHSWTEIFLRGHGWVVFDVTPRAAGEAGVGPVEVAGGPPDLSEFQEPGEGEGGDGETAASDRGPDGSGISERLGKGSALSDLVSYVVFCLALLMFALWYYLKRDPEREAMAAAGRGGELRRNLPAYLVEFCALLRAFGLDPQHGETLVEMMKALGRTGVPVGSFDAMKRYHYSTRYEDQPIDPKQEKLFLQEVRAFLKEQLAAAK